jgi:hypothetical protein
LARLARGAVAHTVRKRPKADADPKLAFMLERLEAYYSAL